MVGRVPGGRLRPRAVLLALLVVAQLLPIAPAANAETVFVPPPDPTTPDPVARLAGGSAPFSSTLSNAKAKTITSPRAYLQASADGLTGWGGPQPWIDLALTSPAADLTAPFTITATSELDGLYYRIKFTNGVTEDPAQTYYSLPARLRVVKLASASRSDGTAGVTAVTITGSGFSDGTLVEFDRQGGGTIVADSTANSSTSLVLTVPGDAKAGPGTLRVSSFGVTDSTAFTVFRPIATIDATASATEVTAGQVVRFSAATWTPTPQVTWQSRTDGSAWADVSTGSIYDRMTQPADDGRLFRAIARSDSSPDATSSTITLRVLSVVDVPASNVGTVVQLSGTGFTDGMSVRFTGSSRWVPAQYLTRRTASVLLPTDASAGSFELSSGSLRAMASIGINLPTVVRSPTLPDVSSGSVVVTSAEAVGAASIAWQSATDASDWRPIPGATAGDYAFTATGASDGVYLRALFSSAAGSVPSGHVRLRVVSAGTLSQTSARIGTTITVGGSGFVAPMRVRFGGSSWVTATDVTRSSLTAVVPADASTGYVDVSTATGSVVARGPQLIVGPVPVLTQSPISATDGNGLMTLSMAVTDQTSATWSVWSGGTWVVVANATTYTFPVTPASDGTRFLATAWNDFGTVTQEVTVSFLSIDHIDPTTATSGTLVTITGTGFPTGPGSTIRVTVGGTTYDAQVQDRTTATFTPTTSGAVSVTLGGVTVTGPTFTRQTGGGTDTGPGSGGGGLPPIAGVLGATGESLGLGLPATGKAGRTLPLPAKSPAGAALTYASTTGRVCIVMGNTLWLISVGTCTITATAGDPASGAATPATVTLTVEPATPTLVQRLVSGRSSVAKGSLGVRKGAVVVSRLRTPLTLVGATVELWFTAAGKPAVRLATRKVSGAGEATYRIVATPARLGTYQWRFRGTTSYLAAKSSALVLRRR